MTPSPVSHPVLHRAMACVLAALMLLGSLVPAAFGATSAVTSAAKKPTCSAGSTLAQKTKKVRKKKKVRVHGKIKRKKVWVTTKVWVCVPAAASTAGDKQAPTAPGGLDAIAGNGQVTLVWNAATDNVGVTGYRVFRNGAQIAAPGTPGHTDTAVTGGATYTYGVAAVDAAGNVSATATISATAKAGAAAKDTTAPTAPPAFTATPGDRQVVLNWGAATDDVGVQFYELHRDGVTISFQESRTFTDTQLTNGTTYTYTVYAVDAAGNLSPAATVTGTPADTVAPSAPAGLTATPGDTQVSLSWSAATDNVGVTKYRVYRDNAMIAEPTTLYYADSGLQNGQQHAYKVVAVDAAGNASPASATVNATPTAPSGGDGVAPSQPTGVVATAGTNQVSLTWAASTDNVGVTKYLVYRGATLVGQPAGPSYLDTGLTNGQQYSYTVVAVDAANNQSPASAAVNATPHDTLAPTVPGGLTVTKNNAQHSITIGWTASTDNVGVSKYRLYRKTNSGAYVLVSQPTGTSYTDLDLANGKTYTYTVEALDAAGNVSAQAPAVSTYVS